MGQVQGKVALVTGGASGIGAACAQTLAREGAKVVVADIDDVRGETLVETIRKAGGEAAYFNQDVTSEARWSEIVQTIESKYGRLDILVSNAGIGISVPITEMTLADWRKQTAINLDGVFLSVKYCIPAMRRAGGGSIVMMSSLAGLRGAAGLTGYCATKGGVRLFAKAVAMECATALDNIRVNSVHPGIIDTPIWGKIPTGAEQNRSNAPIDPHERARDAVPLARAGEAQDIANAWTEEAREKSNNSMGRPGRPQEIVTTALYLASPASSFTTGAIVRVDGGDS